MTKRAPIAIVLTALAVAGCGGSGQGQQVKSAFEHIMSELESRNPAVCSDFTARYALENTGQPNHQAALAICRRHVSSGAVPVPHGIKVKKTKVEGSAALVVVVAPGQGKGIFHMLKQGGRWKIDSVTAK